MPSSARQSANRQQHNLYLHAVHHINKIDDKTADSWLYGAVSLSDWIMVMPQDPDYIPPFHMQGCALP
jgi:hypothetical protein